MQDHSARYNPHFDTAFISPVRLFPLADLLAISEFTWGKVLFAGLDLLVRLKVAALLGQADMMYYVLIPLHPYATGPVLSPRLSKEAAVFDPLPPITELSRRQAWIRHWRSRSPRRVSAYSIAGRCPHSQEYRDWAWRLDEPEDPFVLRWPIGREDVPDYLGPTLAVVGPVATDVGRACVVVGRVAVRGLVVVAKFTAQLT